MANSAPQEHIAIQGIKCPECGEAKNHIQDFFAGEGLHPYGRSNERMGMKTLFACEAGHAWIFGAGEHMGSSFAYVRLPLGGEVVEQAGYYESDPGTLSKFKFSGREEPQNWHPACYGCDTLELLDSGMFAW